MSNYCTQKGRPCEFANLNGYCQNSACIKSFSITYEAWDMKPLTNADRIRAMSNEELADFMKMKKSCPDETKHKGCVLSCGECWLEWLNTPAK